MTVAAALLAAVLTAAAPPAPRPCVEARPVTAPCSGIIVPLGQARDAILCRTAELPQCRAQVRRCQALRATDRTEAARIEEALRAQLAIASHRPAPSPPVWYERPWVAGVVGAAAGLAAGAAIAYAVTR